MKWQRLRRAVETALDADSAARDSIVADVCGGDAELLAEARSLLAQAADAALPAEPPLGHAGERVLLESAAMANVGRRFGPYRVVSVLSAGSTGTVFRAVRDDAVFDREVAIKVLRDAADPEALGRFGRELQALARAEHPGICRLLDAGTTPEGQSFIAMELVRGVPIDEHCRTHRVSLESRVRLLIQACEAVAHAHGLGIVHRDLKPANILVDNTGVAKIIDFGVARLIGEPRGSAWRTETGRLIGTLAYMSPEQIGGAPDRIDHRTDVYGLGVVLWEVLAGRPAFDVRDRPFVEAARVVERDDPERLGSLDRSLRGDLETIVMTALQKDPARRYQSVRALADDLERYLRVEPIVARSPSLPYQFGKFARRHGALLVAVIALVTGLAIAVAATGIALVRTRAEARRALAVSEFLGGVVTGLDPYGLEPGGASARRSVGRIQVVDLLDQAVGRLDAGEIRDARTEADIRHSLAIGYEGVGDTPAALVQAREAAELRERVLGPEDERTLEAGVTLGMALVRLGEVAEAATLLDDVIDRCERVLGNSHEQTFRARLAGASCAIFSGRADVAGDIAAAMLSAEQDGRVARRDRMALARATAAIAMMAGGEMEAGEVAGSAALEELAASGCGGHYIAGLCASTVGMMAELRGDVETAEARYREAHTCFQSLMGDDDPRTAAFASGLGQLLCRPGRFDEAREILEPAARVLEEEYGRLDVRTRVARASLAAALHGLGRSEEAARLVEETYDTAVADLGESDAVTLEALAHLAAFRACEQRWAEAESLARAAMAGLGTQGSGGQIHRGVAAWALASALRGQNRAAEAAVFLEPLLRDWRDDPHEDPSVRARLWIAYGHCLADLGRTAEAEDYLSRGVRGLEACWGAGHGATQEATQALERLRSGR